MSGRSPALEAPRSRLQFAESLAFLPLRSKSVPSSAATLVVTIMDKVDGAKELHSTQHQIVFALKASVASEH
jgi:hypothetical protein